MARMTPSEYNKEYDKRLRNYWNQRRAIQRDVAFANSMGVTVSFSNIKNKIPKFEKPTGEIINKSKVVKTSKSKSFFGKPVNAPALQRSPMVPIRKELTQGQLVLQELMGGNNQTWGTGQNLPEINETLTSGNGIVKSGDYERRTARLFGFGQ